MTTSGIIYGTFILVVAPLLWGLLMGYTARFLRRGEGSNGDPDNDDA